MWLRALNVRACGRLYCMSRQKREVYGTRSHSAISATREMRSVAQISRGEKLAYADCTQLNSINRGQDPSGDAFVSLLPQRHKSQVSDSVFHLHRTFSSSLSLFLSLSFLFFFFIFVFVICVRSLNIFQHAEPRLRSSKSRC